MTRAIVSLIVLGLFDLFVVILAQLFLHAAFEGRERDTLAERQPWAFLVGLVIGAVLMAGSRTWGWFSKATVAGGLGFGALLAWGLVIGDANRTLFLLMMASTGAMVPVILFGSRYPFPPRSARRGQRARLVIPSPTFRWRPRTRVPLGRSTKTRRRTTG
jgi:hypothetical protein